MFRTTISVGRVIELVPRIPQLCGSQSQIDESDPTKFSPRDSSSAIATSPYFWVFTAISDQSLCLGIYCPNLMYTFMREAINAHWQVGPCQFMSLLYFQCEIDWTVNYLYLSFS